MNTFFRNFGRTNVKDSHSYVYHLGYDSNTQRNQKTFTIDECTPWVGKRVLVNLQKFGGNTVGTIKYIGIDPQGILCAGIEFDTFIGGMSGKVNGQKLFKCKQGHGLLVPVERVILMDQNNSSHSAMSRTKSMPNISRNEASNKTWNLATFVPDKLEFLNIGDNVVWMGGASPATGIVRWIGRENSRSPIKVWLEMDEMIGYGNEEQIFCCSFGCERGRGRFLPVEELMLLSDFLPSDSAPESNKLSRSVSTFDTSASGSHTSGKRDTVDSANTEGCAVGTLIDLFDSPNEETKMSGADTAFFATNQQTFPSASAVAVVNDPFVVTLPENLGPFPPASIPTAPLLSPVNPSSTNPFNTSNLVDPNPVANIGASNHQGSSPLWNVGPSSSSAGDTPPEYGFQAGVLETPKITPPPVVVKKMPSPDRKSDYLPSFIVPPINIHEFYKTRGFRGIQGNRNSCYIDVVLFSMFGFTNVFDSRMLEETGKFNNQPETEVTRLTRKALAENIVNPLRSQYYCSSEGVTKLREILVHLSYKLDGAFMDVEEFMLMLFDKVFHLEEFIHYDINVKDYMHQINLGTSATLARVNTVGTCLQYSMAEYRLKFQEIPTPAFIIQMPRTAGNMVEDAIIIPTLTLNISNLMSDQGSSKSGTTLNLLAVICIHDHHYTTFVKCGEGALSHWVFYDSNPSEGCPKIEILPKMGEWLEGLERGCNDSPTTIVHDRHKYHPMLQNLLSNAYVCIYFSPEAILRESYRQK